ncbi:hypothetical protein LV457_07585 [Mycobacterium sp. MYCO198283]|uniref:hypothetical protein n=1 Tax=Mycobacterium sp. MYCO198283 TaxID=2883505 RepID=UPI001E47E7DD|nr:hypothetical protein [Mycobacterium sp. MYCO198283]MCG5432153.1 hypothetical protein [Mycobacterium sp. MYCO198283]
MNITRAIYASTLATGIGAAGLFGVGLGAAAAAPGEPCGAPNTPACGPAHPGGPGQSGRNDGRGPDIGPENGPGRGPDDWQARGVDQARSDHQPFNWNGQRVIPVPAGNGAGWGFWFLGIWIPL